MIHCTAERIRTSDRSTKQNCDGISNQQPSRSYSIHLVTAYGSERCFNLGMAQVYHCPGYMGICLDRANNDDAQPVLPVCHPVSETL